MRYQILWEVVGLEQGPLSQELLERKSSYSSLENQDYSHTDYATPLYPQKLALTSPTSGTRSIGIVWSRTQATKFFSFILVLTLDSIPSAYSSKQAINKTIIWFSRSS
jgi:hypothetical protein